MCQARAKALHGLTQPSKQLCAAGAIITPIGEEAEAQKDLPEILALPPLTSLVLLLKCRLLYHFIYFQLRCYCMGFSIVAVSGGY